MSDKEDLIYTCKLSSQLSKEEKEGFLQVFNRVFNTNYDLEWFNWKYLDNIYGDSYIVLAYDKNKVIGIRAFWRNDIGNYLCYQPCDTAVLKEYRGRGIFTKTSLTALENTKGAFIYNFPNENSLPGNLKLGWKIDRFAYLEPVFNKVRLKDETHFIDDDYLMWRFIKSPIKKYHYCQKGGEFYLLFNRGKNIYYVLGRFNGKFKDYFIKASFPILFKYTTNKTIIYKIFKNKATIVFYNNGIEVEERIPIPEYKADYF
ncbi:GNAT family N-acetyltransferase [Tepidimicrobium xylanilyticum]|uniref:Acetyltransferase (GNAT) domain-containing protein n=1 Tax=Tepidimicrobium xylanilyticum TaxID=1123352 RepID=A0A1H2V4A4_9FIRM|nr:GNAT family N-acetyltransferase [Tepidimicrobium xylanilyticum]GMG96743.1 hypothetical protein EN5CB1_15690 [Tepidimicrobium xylanilyticum]SDW62784.1 Acetyltransferase (GNAT) domain-containing protein [Tepidimicrobium xylanilyticum]